MADGEVCFKKAKKVKKANKANKVSRGNRASKDNRASKESKARVKNKANKDKKGLKERTESLVKMAKDKAKVVAEITKVPKGRMEGMAIKKGRTKEAVSRADRMVQMKGLGECPSSSWKNC